MMTVFQVISKIEQYMAIKGGHYADWYVGIAADPRQRLFSDHNVREIGDWWIYEDCGNDTAARQVEDYFLNKGCDGGPGGGDHATRYAYAYRKAAHTNP